MIESKIQQAEKRYQELSDRLIHPDTFANSVELQKIAKEHADLEPLIRVIADYRKVSREMDESRSFLSGNDPDMKSLAQAELPGLEAQRVELESEIKKRLVPTDPNGQRNAIMEIRAGTGGEEAALFAADLFRMYSRYIEKIGMKMELIDSNTTEIGGLKEIVFSIIGKSAYGKFRFESGTHRVQRVPQDRGVGSGPYLSGNGRGFARGGRSGSSNQGFRLKDRHLLFVRGRGTKRQYDLFGRSDHPFAQRIGGPMPG